MHITDSDIFCRRCLIGIAAKDAEAELDSMLKMIDEKDLADDKTYKNRIDVCRQCGFLLGDTCNVCGCYVEFRANIKHGKCPKKKWHI